MGLAVPQHVSTAWWPVPRWAPGVEADLWAGSQLCGAGVDPRPESVLRAQSSRLRSHHALSWSFSTFTVNVSTVSHLLAIVDESSRRRADVGGSVSQHLLS